MKFGIFMAPFHRVGENPALAFERDMQLIEWLDELGFDEAFIGEHHSAGWEIISSPEIFMAVAATRTKRIMLGSGVVSVPYHHPFNIANRFALLDQLTRGRVILGCGPGALPSDAYMLGIETTTQRDRMVEGIKAMMRLFNEDGGVTIDGSFFKMRDAHLQVKPYQKPHMPVFVANTFSPSGMVAAGQLGCGVLSIATFAPGGLNELPKRWAMGEEIAAENGKTLDRNNWRLVFPVHLAESKKEALDDIRDGCNLWIQKYFIETLGAKIQFEEYPGQPTEEMTADRMASRGGVIVGTPDDAIAKIKEVWEASGGGFGGLLLLAHEWAPREKILHSYELWARYVAPQFQGSTVPIQFSQHWTEERRDMLFGTSVQAIMKSMQDYKESREAAGHKPSELADRPITRVRP
ncbi:MAG TPA: LLM class flavin-dependent oxidoreductase [Candidatus Binataceae bacterium]|nr:LLM class flavin-dependent oxidoreductase [Candidatus Binataceae bacterium]